jgi:Protein of unknown function (DUF5818)
VKRTTRVRSKTNSDRSQPLSSFQTRDPHRHPKSAQRTGEFKMSKTILLTSTFLACTAWMAAQGTPSSSGSAGSSSSAGQSSGQAGSQSGATTTGQSGSENGQTAGAPASSGRGSTTLRGCLSSSGGGYTLTDASGTQYQLSGDNSKLSQHVNNEVEVKGSTTGSSGASASSGSAAGSQSATGSAGTGSAGQMFNVTKVKKVSGSCNTSGTNH